MEEKRRVALDPFLDGTTMDGATDASPQNNENLVRQLPRGPDGLPGTVIPSAAPGTGGGQLGGSRFPTEIHVDPDLPGHSRVVKVGALTAENIEAAAGAVEDAHPLLRPSAIYDSLSTTPTGHEALAPESPPPVAGPLGAFRSPEEDTPEKKAAPVLPPQPAASASRAPTTWVTFEIEGFGEHRAPFHSVIRQGNTLVLVYDTRCEGSQKFFPRATDRPLGIHVHSETVAYYALTTGIEFQDDGKEYCILLIEREAPIGGGGGEGEE